ncbi:hypothetical protein PI124_g14456 [Phytophthora idaei]|nr:hypothetical protein PI125_g14216 [Phytophthora idaei]KAG3146395.1 hypothetical protein PI126_g13339 [Phytophthora idaei]KAG3240652.1 hypothetical protein PI124_g14456 [Phytophthora idaei]
MDGDQHDLEIIREANVARSIATNELAAENVKNVTSQESVAPWQSPVINKEAIVSQQAVTNQETIAWQGPVAGCERVSSHKRIDNQESAPSQVTIANENTVAGQATAANRESAAATYPRKRGRPEGSKNKRKQSQTAVD